MGLRWTSLPKRFITAEERTEWAHYAAEDLVCDLFAWQDGSYEFNTEQKDTHVTHGQAFTVEWGFGKTLHQLVDVGVVGYYQQKVTDDSGPAKLVAPQDRLGTAEVDRHEDQAHDHCRDGN